MDFLGVILTIVIVYYIYIQKKKDEDRPRSIDVNDLLNGDIPKPSEKNTRNSMSWKTGGGAYDFSDDDSIRRLLGRGEAVSTPSFASEWIPLDALMDENNYHTTYAESPYIQNNTKPVAAEMRILTPSFNVESFITLVKGLFTRAVEEGTNAHSLAFVLNSVDLNELPEKFDYIKMCYINNYIKDNTYEALKCLVEIDTKDPKEQIRKFFVTLRRENAINRSSNGEVINVSCPNCGGVVQFDKPNQKITQCPYCGQTVTFAEYDWAISEVERIKPETKITNRALVDVQKLRDKENKSNAAKGGINAF